MRNVDATVWVRAWPRGFSLVELLALLAVAGTLASAAMPALKSMTASMRVSAASNEILADLYLARSEAMKRKNRVTLCKSADGQNCAASGGWHQGWIVFVDVDANGLRSSGEPVLRRQQALDAELSLTGNSNVAKYVSYADSGSTRLAGGGFQAGTLTVCRQAATAGTGRQIVLNATGRPRVQKVALASCA